MDIAALYLLEKPFQDLSRLRSPPFCRFWRALWPPQSAVPAARPRASAATRFADPADHFRPRVLQAQPAEALGFAADTGMDEAVQAFIKDDLEMQKQLVQRSR